MTAQLTKSVMSGVSVITDSFCLTESLQHCMGAAQPADPIADPLGIAPGILQLP